jgi:Uma2 family endonuclease
MATEATLTAERSAPRAMTFEEFHDWLDEDTWAELAQGEVIVMSPAGTGHQDVGGFLLAVLRCVAEQAQAGHVFGPPTLMRLEAADAAREPDVMYVAEGHAERIQRTYIDGPADLVVEILSASSRRRDRGDKYFEYERAGVPEYWLIDPERHLAEFYVLGADGVYEMAFGGRSGRFESSVLPGLWLDVEWLWQSPLPTVVSVLRQLGLV